MSCAADSDPVNNIYAAMVRIRQAVPVLRPEGEMSGFGDNYAYLTIEQAIDALRPLMDREGVSFHPCETVIATQWEEDRGNDKYGNPKSRMKYARVLVTYKLVHAASGSYLTVQVPGEAMDTGDKVLNKAMTSAEKVCLRQAFLLMTNDDPDRTPSPPRDDQESQPPKALPVFKPGEGLPQETLDLAIKALEEATDEARVRYLMDAAFKRKWTQMQWDLLKVLANKRLDSFAK